MQRQNVGKGHARGSPCAFHSPIADRKMILQPRKTYYYYAVR
jgi:hypothetical protein